MTKAPPIHPMWVIDEYAINLARDVCIKPPSPPTTTEQPIKILTPPMLGLKDLIKLRGAIFCHVNKIA